MGEQGNWWVPQLTRFDGEVIKVWKPQKWEWVELMAIVKKFNEDNICGNLKDKLTSTKEIMFVAGNRSKTEREAENYRKMLSKSEFIEAQGDENEMKDFLNITA